MKDEISISRSFPQNNMADLPFSEELKQELKQEVQQEALRLLVAYRSKPDLTPLMDLVAQHPKAFWSDSCDYDPLRSGIEWGLEAPAMYLVHRGLVRLDLRLHTIMPPLMAAAHRNMRNLFLTLLIQDEDLVDPNELWWFVGHNVVWWAAAYGHFWVLLLLIAHRGPRIYEDLWLPQPTLSLVGSTPANVARITSNVKCAKILEKFEKFPQDVEHQVQWRFGFPEARATRLLAQVALLCDGFLHLKTSKDVEITKSRENQKNRKQEFFFLPFPLPLLPTHFSFRDGLLS